MFSALTEKIEKVLKKLRGQGVLNEQNVAEALKEVRFALLKADVNFKIVKDFISRVQDIFSHNYINPGFDIRDLDLVFLKLNFGFHLKMNLLTFLGIILGFYLYKNI